MSFVHHPFTRLGGAIVLAVCAVGAMLPREARAEDRAYLTKAEIEMQIVGHGILSKNLASGKFSHWEFHPDGRVDAVSKNGLGSASGTWTLRDDGQMCVKMVGRTGCRYWFHKGNSFANADTNAPDAETVAEVSYE